MKYILLTFLIYTNVIFSQNTANEEIIVKILKESIIPDFHHFLGLDMLNKKIKPSIYFSKNNIELDINRFEIRYFEINNKNKQYYSFESYGNEINDSNFIVFNSFQVENMVIFEVFYKREEHFNIPNESEYEYWRRMNGGVSYYFKFDKNNFLIDFKKKWFSYD